MMNFLPIFSAADFSPSGILDIFDLKTTVIALFIAAGSFGFFFFVVKAAGPIITKGKQGIPEAKGHLWGAIIVLVLGIVIIAFADTLYNTIFSVKDTLVESPTQFVP